MEFQNEQEANQYLDEIEAELSALESMETVTPEEIEKIKNLIDEIDSESDEEQKTLDEQIEGDLLIADKDADELIDYAEEVEEDDILEDETEE